MSYRAPGLSDLQLVDLAGTGSAWVRSCRRWRRVHRAVLNKWGGDIGCSSYRMSAALK